MTLREIARVSAAEGLTAQEASKKYGINMYSLRKIICRHRMPQLITERERDIETQFKNMTDAQILNYKSILELPKNKDVGATERQMLSNELARRNIK
jgi:hypothetical protein